MNINSYQRAIINTSERLIFPFRLYMMRYKCIFIHIPKAAGTSVLELLTNGSMSRDHLPWFVYYVANSKRFKSYYKFAFVRDPWERAYSAYRYLISGGNHSSDLIISREIKQFGTFDNFLIEGLGRGHFRSHLLFLPQSSFIIGNDARPVVNFLGRYETIRKDFKVIGQQLGINGTLPHRNKTDADAKINPELIYHRNEAVDVITEVYKEDIKSFGYVFKKSKYTAH